MLNSVLEKNNQDSTFKYEVNVDYSRDQNLSESGKQCC